MRGVRRVPCTVYRVKGMVEIVEMAALKKLDFVMLPALPSRTGVHRIASLMPPLFAARTVAGQARGHGSFGG